MTNETKAENMLLDKKWTRKRLIDEVLKGQADNRDLLAERSATAANLSEAIGDSNPFRPHRAEEHKMYNLADAIERAFELIIEARKVPELEARIERCEAECEAVSLHLQHVKDERDNAQEAVALVGATFNDYRTADIADKMVSEYERVGGSEHWSIGSKDEAANWASRQCCKPI